MEIQPWNSDVNKTGNVILGVSTSSGLPGLAISWWNTVDDRNILSSSIMTGFFWGYVDILLEKTKVEMAMVS